MAKLGTASLTINDLEMHWSEDSGRAQKPCVKCGELTQGRMTSGSDFSQPAHISCAMSLTFDRALQEDGLKPSEVSRG